MGPKQHSRLITNGARDGPKNNTGTPKGACMVHVARLALSPPALRDTRCVLGAIATPKGACVMRVMRGARHALRTAKLMP